MRVLVLETNPSDVLKAIVQVRTRLCSKLMVLQTDRLLRPESRKVSNRAKPFGTL